jgi:hypothetical protein
MEAVAGTIPDVHPGDDRALLLSITSKSTNPMENNDDQQCDIRAPHDRHDDFPDHLRSSRKVTAYTKG